jgi:hypothetical protein
VGNSYCCSPLSISPTLVFIGSVVVGAIFAGMAIMFFGGFFLFFLCAVGLLLLALGLSPGVGLWSFVRRNLEKDAIRVMERDPRVQEALGTPLQVWPEVGYESERIKEYGYRTVSLVQFGVQGPKGKALVRVVAVKPGAFSRWKQKVVQVSIPRTGETFTISGDRERETSKPIPIVID